MNETDLRKLDDEMLDAYRTHNIDVILSHCGDDIVMHDFGEEPVTGKDACRQYLEEQFATFSGDSFTRTHRILGDNEVFSEVTWTATNTGDLKMPDGSSIPATGKPINTRVAYYARVNDGDEVVEVRGYPDIASMMGQLGLMG